MRKKISLKKLNGSLSNGSNLYTSSLSSSINFSNSSNISNNPCSSNDNFKHEIMMRDNELDNSFVADLVKSSKKGIYKYTMLRQKNSSIRYKWCQINYYIPFLIFYEQLIKTGRDFTLALGDWSFSSINKRYLQFPMQCCPLAHNHGFQQNL